MPPAIPRIPPPVRVTNCSGSQSHASYFAVVIERPNQGLGQLPSMSEQPQGSGVQVSAADLHRLDQYNENDIRDNPDIYEDGQYTDAYAYATDSLLAPSPSRLLNPDYSSQCRISVSYVRFIRS